MGLLVLHQRKEDRRGLVQIDDLNVQNETVSIRDHGMIGSEGDEVVSDWIFIQSETEKHYSSEQYKN